MAKQKKIVKFVGRHGIVYERYADKPLLTCKFVGDPRDPDNGKFGFGDIHSYNADLDLYTIIDDGGRVVQRQGDFVSIAGDGKVAK